MFPRSTPHQTIRHIVRAAAEEALHSLLGCVRADCPSYSRNCAVWVEGQFGSAYVFRAARSSVTLSRGRFSRSSTSLTCGKGKGCPGSPSAAKPKTIRQSRRYPHRWMVPVLLPKSRPVQLVWLYPHQGSNAVEMERISWGYLGLGRTSGWRNGEVRVAFHAQ